MDISGVISSWRDSRKVLATKALRQIMLVSLKTFVSALKPLMYYFWWLFVLIGIDKLFIEKLDVLSVLLFFVALLSVRASIERKDFDYYRTYASRIFGVIVILFLCGGVWALLEGALAESSIVLRLLSMIPFALLSTYNMMACYFLLDTEGGLRNFALSLKRGGVMMLYYLPICLLLGLCDGITNLGFLQFLGLLPTDGGSVALGIYMVLRAITKLFILCVVSIYYIKSKHEAYELFNR